MTQTSPIAHAAPVAPTAATTDPRRLTSIRAALDRAAHVLPIQGPIGVFVHHNTLHALSHLPFHDAIAHAIEQSQTHGYLTEEQYRDAYDRGRILREDLDAALEEHGRGERAAARIGPLSHRALDTTALLHALPVLSEAELAWQLTERDALARVRADAPPAAKESLLAGSVPWLRARGLAGELGTVVLDAPDASLDEAPEAWALAALWKACQGVRSSAGDERTIAERVPSELSHQDLLRDATGIDPASQVNPWLVRFCAAYLDRGMAAWPMRGRERGMLACFREHVLGATVPLPHALHAAREAVRDHARRGLDAESIVVEILADLGVGDRDREAYLARILLALPGWAGMVHRLETHPEERSPGCMPSLLDYVAIRLTLDRAAWAEVAARELGFHGPLSRLPRTVQQRARRPRHDRPAARAAAFRLFGVCQLAGLAAPDVLALSARDRQAIVDRLDAFDAPTRRRIWHEAYERRYREQALSALARLRQRRDPNVPRPAPRWQLSFCFDDREESLRRHIEELEPRVETFGVAGFYGLAIDYVGLDAIEPAPLCPAGVVPQHVIHEVPDAEHAPHAASRTVRRGRLARLLHLSRRGTRSLVRGAVLTPVLGLASAFPLVAQLLFPRSTDRLRRRAERLLLPAPRTQVTHTRADDEPATTEGRAARGLTLREQIDRVAATLENIGLTRGFAPLVVTLGHGSASINNPHESAYNCGACGGRQGGPNGRLFAALCNRPEVRAGLRERGIAIPESTYFLGGMHNTANDEITLADLDRVPGSHTAEVAALRDVLDRARARDAHERCRRFANVPLDLTPEGALRHVEARVVDLGQPRPEYNHATIALCVVGRRALTRGLFLDRRAFVVAYDPTIDREGRILERILQAAAPVGSGISLEYYFSTVDNDRYGSGTKTPHNLSGLIGVMDGHASDLRTGLTAEMVEIHEPMRLLTVVESTPERLLEIARRQPDTVGGLVMGAWMQLVCIHPDDGRMHRFVPSRGAFEPWEPGPGELGEVAASLEAYRGRRDHLPIVLVRDGAEGSVS